MHGKVLVIDPIATNRIVLRVKFAACHYEVVQADSIAEAMQVIRTGLPDLILCSTKMPDGGPLRLMSRLQKTKAAGKVPVIALSCSAAPAERMRLLAAGLEDVLQKPLDDALLIARARSVIRAYASASEWQLRDDTSRALGFAEPSVHFGPAQTVKLVASRPDQLGPWQPAFCARSTANISTCTPADAVGNQTDVDETDAFVLVVEPGKGPQMLSLLATIRSHSRTRHSAILVVQVEADAASGAQMLDMGANDLMCSDPDPAELALRLETLLTRKRLGDALRDTVRSGVEAAVSDPLTGLHNRRYAMPHLARIAERAASNRKPFAVMVADMDHFKQINDVHGHAAGDAVLVETAKRLRENLRAVDLLARIGGEEFLIVLPGADLANARNAATRLCHIIRKTPFEVPGQGVSLSATISIGLTVCDPVTGATTTLPQTAEALLDRADKALYGAKADGRNRVVLHRPAA
ncbi:diguanylate cyclase [Tateyamaria pelophila]|uniref:diguanylate cyclase n=1 Tax=Tateyamaria pelophila TaxID=328415 RepID=UPI001CC01C93|nr:diguanylate cyclase [Tateyamaria pelophila]